MKFDKEFRVFIGFLTAFVLAVFCILHIFFVYPNPPLSTHASTSHRFLIGAAVILILGSIISFVILKTKNGSELWAIINWLIMIIGLYCCLVVIIRSTTWFCLSTEDKVYDMKNQTVYELQYGAGVDKMFEVVMQKKHCCGISNILDWGDLKFSAETSTGEKVSISDEATTHRFVPDICCVEKHDECGNEAFDNVEDKNMTGNHQMKDREAFEKILANRPADGRTEILKVPSPLNDMLLYKLKTLIDLSNTLCSLPPSVLRTKILYIYFHGLVRKSNEAGRLIACHLGEDCEDAENIPYKYEDATVFCTQLNATAQGLNALTEREQLILLQESGLLYTAGCQEYLIESIDTFSICCLLYSFVTFIVLCWEIAAFHEYYWRFKGPQLQAQDKPIWYEAFENEEELIRMAEEGGEEPTPSLNANDPNPPPEASEVRQEPKSSKAHQGSVKL
ncbi:Tetraspanin-9 [Orchesella cincta]|uniref:Tetraspanin-9 n=1 Tax=Orchesella cincta TaxID=48709 RepID=A0A1D2MEG2_ORCCI|nr:Tetraspanin-9 [Orchesella cincta]